MPVVSFNSCPLAGDLQLKVIWPLIPELTWNKLEQGEVKPLQYDLEKWRDSCLKCLLLPSQL